VRSQAAEGWTLPPEAYDDGGVSGGTLERPALRRLLADVAAGRVDMIVVYKIDRLTRSLADFAKLVEALEAAGASFVSVTQSFNTSTSMGRLTLNMLLSFAQFEREVTAERIRDKIAASRRRGLWTGGPPPLGYDVKDKALVPNADEAETVRRIFATYLELGSIRDLKAALDRADVVSKRRTRRSGRVSGGRPLGRGALELILRNPVYVGEVRSRGERYPGRHAAIVDRKAWEAVQAKLDAQATRHRTRSVGSEPSLLKGLIVDAAGDPLTPSHASKGPARLRYRYYVSHRLMAGRAKDHPDAWRLPARPVEDAVRATLAALLRGAEARAALVPTEASAGEHRRFASALDELASGVVRDAALDVRSLLLQLDARVGVLRDRLRLEISANALAERLAAGASSVDRMAIDRPLSIRKRGSETRVVLGDVETAAPDPALAALLAEARDAMRRLQTEEHTSVRALARALDRDHRRIARTLPLAFLAPDIAAAILDGRQPPELTASALLRMDDMPLAWPEQRRRLGFPDIA
ncbi:MAG: recombinase family protein, partial [Pseudomonadota bacterium]